MRLLGDEHVCLFDQGNPFLSSGQLSPQLISADVGAESALWAPDGGSIFVRSNSDDGKKIGHPLFFRGQKVIWKKFFGSVGNETSILKRLRLR